MADNRRGKRGNGHPYKDGCSCRRCTEERHHLFTIDLRKTVNHLTSQGGRTVTGSYTDDRGNRGRTMAAAMVPTFDPSAPMELENGVIEPLTDAPFVDKSITATQGLSSNPLFTPDQVPVTLIGVTTVQNGKEVNIIHKTKVTRGVKPVRSLLGPKPNFTSFDGLKRRTSRSSEIIREHENVIAPEVFRLSYNRPDHLARQDKQEGDLLDAELGLTLPNVLPDDADLA